MPVGNLRNDPARRGVDEPDLAAQSVPHQLFVEQSAYEPTHHVATRALRVTARSLRDRRMEVGALESHPAGACEAVEHEVPGAAEQPGLEPIQLLGHLDRVVAVDP